MPGNSQLNPYGSQRSIFGRSGFVYVGGDWVATATEITATLSVDNMEIRRAGDYWLRHKPGQISGEGSLTVEKVNSSWEANFINYINGTSNRPPTFDIEMVLNDPGMPTEERITLKEATFWSIPLGFSIDDILTRELDFTFYGVSLDTPIGGVESTSPGTVDVNDDGVIDNTF